MAGRSMRWADRATGVLLLGSSCMVALVAAPEVLRAAIGGPRVQVADRLPRDLWRRGERPARGPAGGSDAALPDPSPHGVLPRALHGAPGGERADRIRSGIARRDLKVFGEPSLNAVPIGELKAGDEVMLVRGSGDWALVVHTGEDGVVMGWTQRSEIALP